MSPPPSADNLLEADAALTLVTDPVGPDLLAAAPRLRVVANMAVGYDNLDAEAAAAAGVWATNTPGVLHETTADLAFALLLAAARNLVLSDRDTRDGGWVTWSPTAFLGHDPYGSTLGIVGLGEIGRAVARRAAGFGMTVLAATRTPRPESSASSASSASPCPSCSRAPTSSASTCPTARRPRASWARPSSPR